MGVMHGDDEAFVTQRLKVKSGAITVQVSPRHRQINQAFIQQLNELITGVPHQFDSKLRKSSFHFCNGLNHKVRRCTHDRSDRQASMAPLAFFCNTFSTTI
ncbi:hypothetical protein D3C84_855870 [compost metagenome]